MPLLLSWGLLLFGAPAFGQSVSSVTLAWNPSPGTDIVGYHVYYGLSSGNYAYQLNPGNHTNAAVSGLVAGVTYYFAVTASDALGLESAYSKEISYTPAGPPLLPSQTNIWHEDLTTLTVTNTATNPNVPPQPLSYQLLNPPAGARIDTNGVITWTPTLAQSPSTNLFTTIASTTNSVTGSTLSATNAFLVMVSGAYDGIDLSNTTQAQADKDGDGLSNLMEYGLGLDPRDSADANAGLWIGIFQQSGSRYLVMSFRQRVNAGSLGLQYLPEVSGDRLNWASVPALSVDSLDSQFNRVTVRDLTPIGQGQPRFIRLRIVLGG